MFDYGTIEDLLKSTEHMEILRNNSLQDDGTDTVKGVDWFQYKGKIASTLYVSGKIYLPPSMTAISSWVINSLPQSQVVNSQKASGIKEIHLLYRLPSCFVLILFTVLPLIWDKKKQETFSDFPLSKTVKFF